MRKLVVFSGLLVLLAAAAFAELKIGFEAQVDTDLVYYTKGTQKVDGYGDPKDGEFGKDDKGSFNFFSSNYGWGPGASLRLTFTHTTENTEASMQLKADDLLARTKAGTEDRKWSEILDGTFGDWYFKGNLNALDGYVGNTGYGGKVNAYDNFNDFINQDEYFNPLGGFGVWRKDGWAGSDGLDVWGSEIFALGVTFGDFKVAAGSYLNINGFQEPFDSRSLANAGLIISGDKIADLITFDVFYAFVGGDPNTLNRGTGAWAHRFGVYAGLALSDNLGISFGYTGDVLASESRSDADDKAIPVTNPFYSGIDLHVNVALDKLGITFNNNISFAGVKGIKDNGKDKYVVGITGTELGEDTSEDWFAYSGGLLATYALTDNLSLAFQIADKVGVYTNKYKTSSDNTDTNTVNELRIALSGEYTVGFAKFGCGLNMGVSSNANENKRDKTYKDSLTVFSLGVPMYFRVSF